LKHCSWIKINKGSWCKWSLHSIIETVDIITEDRAWRRRGKQAIKHANQWLQSEFEAADERLTANSRLTLDYYTWITSGYSGRKFKTYLTRIHCFHCVAISFIVKPVCLDFHLAPLQIYLTSIHYFNKLRRNILYR
jgi:hypothetical protein